MTTPDLHEAAFEQQAISWWYDWRRFLTLQIRLLALRSAVGLRADTAFEAADSPEVQERAIREQLDSLPHERRKVFEAELSKRRDIVRGEMEATLREAGQRKLPDPDEVERRTLTVLVEAAEGHHTDGWGEVPTTRGMYDLDVSVLADVPDEQAYKVGGTRNRTAIGVGLIAALTLVFVGALFLISHGGSTTAEAEAETGLLVDEQPVEPWRPIELTLHSAAGAVTFAITDVRGVVAADSPEAGARMTSRWPLTLCVPGEALPEGAVTAEVRSGGAAPMLRYTLAADTSADADLLLRACDGDEVLSGRVSQVDPIQPAAIHSPLQVGGHAITVRAISISGPAEDASLPAGQAEVQVHVVANGVVDWAQLGPSLRSLTDREPRTGTVTPSGAEIVFSYRLPLPTAPLDVAWELTDPASRQLTRWRATLAPPPNRDEYLRSAVVNLTMQATPDGPGRLQLALAITNGAASSLRLGAEDIVVTSGGQRVSINALPELIQPLAEGETRAVTFSLPAGRDPVQVRLGAFAFEVQPVPAAGGG
jgi:hypothetical protein